MGSRSSTCNSCASTFSAGRIILCSTSLFMTTTSNLKPANDCRNPIWSGKVNFRKLVGARLSRNRRTFWRNFWRQRSHRGAKWSPLRGEASPESGVSGLEDFGEEGIVGVLTSRKSFLETNMSSNFKFFFKFFRTLNLNRRSLGSP